MVHDDVTPLANALTKCTITTDKVKIDYRKVHQFWISHDAPQNLQVRLSHDDGEEWKQISLKKSGGRKKLEEVQLSPLYAGSRPIAKAKVEDVKSLLQCGPPIYHQFYNDIAVDNNRKSSTDDSELMDDGDDRDSLWTTAFSSPPYLAKPRCSQLLHNVVMYYLQQSIWRLN